MVSNLDNQFRDNKAIPGQQGPAADRQEWEMGRPERPLDPEAGPVAEFAGELRKLRDKAGRPSYRELARRASFSVTVLSEAAGGRSLPTLAVVKGYVQACGGDALEWEERWRRAAGQQREAAEGAARPAPYQGLASYGVEHAGLFFGREALTRDLLQRVGAGRFIAVFGPSGSGKSSLLRAGLLAAMSRGDQNEAGNWVPILLTPGELPVTTLADHIASLTGTAAAEVRDELLADPARLPAVLAGGPRPSEPLIVVDQFEELFTVCRDRRQRDCFVRALLAAAAADGARTRVVLGVRADYYAQCTTWPELVTALRDTQLLVGPMNSDELQDVIVKPAEQAGATVERALVATALAETSTEPGALALVSHALLETWRHSPPGRMTLTAYQEAGGVPRAIASTADRVYASCDDNQRQILRRIFLRLIAPGDGSRDARCRVAPEELVLGTDPGTAAMLVDRLAQARLVTADDGSVQLAHEALIRFWPRLTEWLAESREDMRVQRRLAEAAAEWARHGHDPAALYRGTRLAVARAWAERDAGLTGLTSAEQDFLDASSAAQDAGRATVIRAARRLRRLVVTLVALLAAMSVTAGVAVWQRESALSAESAAVSGQLAAQSGELAPVNPDAATLAALAAWHADATVSARSALLSTTACCAATQASLRGESGEVDAVALSPDGSLLAAGGQDKTVHLWNTADGRQVAVLSGFTAPVRTVAFGPSGIVLAAGSADHTIRVWNVARHTILQVLTGGTGAIEDLAFDRSGTLLAGVSQDGQVRLWNPATGQPEQTLALPGAAGGTSVAFSPDGRTLAASDGQAVTLWDVTDLAHPRIVSTLAGATRDLTTLAYSPNGTVIAGQETGGGVVLWNLGRGTRMLLPGPGSGSRGLAFNGDGTILLTADYDLVRMWATASGRLAGSVTRQVPGTSTALAYSSASGTLALGGFTGSVQLWQAPIPPFAGNAAGVTGLAIIPGSTSVLSGSSDGTLCLWRANGSLVASWSLPTRPDALAVSRDGKLVAIAADDGTIGIRALPGLALTRSLHAPSAATDVAFSADGGLVAAAAGATVTVWNTASGARLLSVTVIGRSVDAIAFSPRGDGDLAAITSRGLVIIWDALTGRVVAQARTGTGRLSALAFSPDGRRLATAANGDITLWNPVNLRRLGAVAGPVGSVKTLALSPDGQVLASGENNGSILLWDMETRSIIATLTGSPGTVTALGFTPDGSVLISGSNSRRIIAWDLDPARVERADCLTLARDPGLAQAQTLVPGASYARLCAAGS
jgi:WD40 repeat protein